MTFAAVAWLWSGLALAVPILLHLLGRGRGVRRRWSSVQLLREAGLSSGARFRPSQPWLLFLRCALLAAVTLALAEPLIESHARAARADALWLVEPGASSGSWRGRAGEVRYLAPGLPSSAPAAAPSATPAAPDLWSLLAEADALFPPGMVLKVVARPRLAGLRGTRPRLRHEVAWFVPPAGSGGSPREAPLPRTGREAPMPRTGVAGTPSIRLLVAAAPERAADAAALRAGLAQAATALGWTIEESADASSAELLASLGRDPPAAWGAPVEHGATLLRDEMGELRACASLVAVPCCGSFPRWQCGGDPAGQGLWRDGAGRPVLARGASGAGAILRFAGRFSPESAGWGRGAFVALLRAAFGDPSIAGVETSIAQALPQRRPVDAGSGTRESLAGSAARESVADSAAGGYPAGGAADGSLAGGAAGGSLAGPLWLLAGGCFAAERWLAARTAAARRRG